MKFWWTKIKEQKQALDASNEKFDSYRDRSAQAISDLFRHIEYQGTDYHYNLYKERDYPALQRLESHVQVLNFIKEQKEADEEFKRKVLKVLSDRTDGV